MTTNPEWAPPPGMTPHYYGITYADAADLLHVAESTVRNWFHRYPVLENIRSRDRRIDLRLLEEWWENGGRDVEQARRRGNTGAQRRTERDDAA
jgi:hypothetical protein